MSAALGSMKRKLARARFLSLFATLRVGLTAGTAVAGKIW
jgi:hypothetical protein